MHLSLNILHKPLGELSESGKCCQCRATIESLKSEMFEPRGALFVLVTITVILFTKHKISLQFSQLHFRVSR